MEKFKNFIYDKSDLLVALAIIVVAAIVIWIGVSNIMEPYTSDADTQTQQELAAETTPSAADSNPSNAAIDNNTSPQAATDKNDSEVSKKTAKIIIKPGETSDDVAEKLVAAEAISSESVFLDKLNKLGLESKIQIGSFEIPQGSSLETICKIVTKTN